MDAFTANGDGQLPSRHSLFASIVLPTFGGGFAKVGDVASALEVLAAVTYSDAGIDLRPGEESSRNTPTFSATFLGMPFTGGARKSFGATRHILLRGCLRVLLRDDLVGDDLGG